MSVSMSNNGSYSNDRPPSASEAELATDPASGVLFLSDYKKHEDLQQMLDSNKDSLKLEAMKRIIGMVAKGKNASDLFPPVVKNVVSKNIEVKKLVYVYLVRYAEEQQDLALLSISTFQRALKDPNQLIRASALRVLSSIRVPMIVPIVMLAIKDSASDMSPYVRKTAAHAIPKLHSLDPEQKDELIIVIEKLLSDKTTLVVGSAVMAFEEVCPERIDLIHKNYRKLCNLLVDVDEWGQVVIISMLTRYARTQFADPNADDDGDDNTNKPFYDDDDDDGDEDDLKRENSAEKDEKIKKSYSLDPDHRLLLRNTKPLLQSRNASVVMSVAQLYHHMAPKSEVHIVAKALIRLLRSHREVQSIVLNCIASVSTKRKGMFEPFLKSFFVRTSDPTHIKLLKLEILTNLATETSISVILREFQTYISSNDKEFVAAAIQAIGRCASSIKEVTDTCLSGLVALLSNRDHDVVAESVVVIKKLLQTQPSEHRDIIVHMAKLVDFINVPQARASILWLLGEYSDRVPKIAPDVLRKMAKSFTNEEDIVKLQILNLAAKLYLTNPKQTNLLCFYVFNLAKYDHNYDIRDRARFLKQFIFAENSKLSKHAKKIFLATKPAPVLESRFKDRDVFQLGSLSHYINARAVGYHDLPPFPEIPPDSSVRDVEPPLVWKEAARAKKQTMKKRSFYSESEETSPDNSDSSSSNSSDEEDSSDDSSEEDESDTSDDEVSDKDSSSEEDDESSSDEVQVVSKSKIVLSRKGQKKKINNDEERGDLEGDDEEDDDDDDEDDDEDEDEDDDEEDEDEDSESSNEEKVQTSTKEKVKPVSSQKPKTNLDLLLELDDVATITPVMTPSLGGFLSPMCPPAAQSLITIQAASPSFVPLTQNELLNKISGHGLQVMYRFTRSPHLFSPLMASVELVFTNVCTDDIEDIKVGQKFLSPGVSMHEFAPIGALHPSSSLPGTLGIDFNDSTQAVSFEIVCTNGNSGEIYSPKVTIKPPVGELLRAVTMNEQIFLEELGKLKGMNEYSATNLFLSKMCDGNWINQKVYEAANVASIPSLEINTHRFAGQTLSSKSLVLVTIKMEEGGSCSIFVNSEKMVIGSMLLNELKTYLRK